MITQAALRHSTTPAGLGAGTRVSVPTKAAQRSGVATHIDPPIHAQTAQGEGGHIDVKRMGTSTATFSFVPPQSTFSSLVATVIRDSAHEYMAPTRPANPLPDGSAPKSAVGRDHWAEVVAVPTAVKEPAPTALPLSLALPTAQRKTPVDNTLFPARKGGIATELKAEEPATMARRFETAFTARIQIADKPGFALARSSSNRDEAAAPPISAAAPRSPLNGAPSSAPPQSVGVAQLGQFQELTNTAQNAGPAEGFSGVAPSSIADTPLSIPSSSPSYTHKEPLPTSRAGLVQEIALPTAATPASLKEITFQIPGARGVEVRLTENAGQVRVDVRSSDPVLTQDLRGNLHDLVSSLEKKGLSSTVTHPVEPPQLRANQTESASNSSSDQGGESSARQQQSSQRQKQSTPDLEMELHNRRARANAWNATLTSHLDTN